MQTTAPPLVPRPSTFALKKAVSQQHAYSALNDDEKQHSDTGPCRKEQEDPLTQTLYYTYQDSGSAVTYPYDVVDQGCKRSAGEGKISLQAKKILDNLFNAWNRLWGRLNDKEES